MDVLPSFLAGETAIDMILYHLLTRGPFIFQIVGAPRITSSALNEEPESTTIVVRSPSTSTYLSVKKFEELNLYALFFTPIEFEPSPTQKDLYSFKINRFLINFIYLFIFRNQCRKPELLQGVFAMGFNHPTKIQEVSLPIILGNP